jgi:hypothetical protein
MSQIAIKPKTRANPLNNDVVIQITKAQLIKFFQFLVIIAMATLNILAVKIASPFLKELFISQVILLLVFFVKNFKSNHISK